MSRPDAERALNIYKTFGRQTDQVVQYLSLARQYENATRLEVPRLKHAPTTLTSSLEEYLNDPDFEVNRRQYLAQQQAKKSGKPLPRSQASAAPATPAKNDASVSVSIAKPPPQPAKGPAPDLIDFFESIEQNQQPMAQGVEVARFVGGSNEAQIFQQPAFAAQATGYNPFGPAPTQTFQHNYNGAQFGGFPPQAQSAQPYSFATQLTSIPQNGVADFQVQPQTQSPAPSLQPQQTSTNPFRQSVIQGNTGAGAIPTPGALNRQSTNPFARNNSAAVQSPSGTTLFQPNGNTSFPPAQTQQPDIQPNAAYYSNVSAPVPDANRLPGLNSSPLQPQRTGTNPFARNRSPPTTTTSPLAPNPTGSTNPFRQSAFVNQQTGQGWQHSNQGTFAGFSINNVDTTPIFPRPGQG